LLDVDHPDRRRDTLPFHFRPGKALVEKFSSLSLSLSETHFSIRNVLTAFFIFRFNGDLFGSNVTRKAAAILGEGETTGS
jgi:hypothetical protein